jgi:TonB-linked SusC/RagA family outer membrane protein
MKSAKLKKLLNIMTLSAFLLITGLGTAGARGGNSSETLEPAQSKTRITGTVVDQTGEPVIGANIVEKGAAVNGTVSDVDGNFSLNVSQGATLVVSYIGYVTQEIAAGNQTVLNIMLIEDSKTLEEVVVVGYGVQKKQSIVGAIVQQSGEDLQKAGHVTDLKQALTGQLPGVITVTASGEPGGVGRGNSATNIYIRGQNTWNGGQALVLVDGVERDMSNIDPNEVESISTLKDASATAVFGVKGANGVILITTRRGNESKMKLSFNYDASAKSVSRLPEKLNSYETLLRKNEMIEREVGLNPSSWNEYTPMSTVNHYRQPQSDIDALLYPDIDWADAMFKSAAWSHRFNLSLTGGTSFINYFGSLSYLHEGDMFEDYDNGKGYDPNYNYDRFNFRTNFDMKITPTTKAKVNLSGYFSQKNSNYNNEGSTSGADQWMWAAAYGLPPSAYPVQFEDGSWGYSSRVSPSMPNPIAVVYNLGIRTTRRIELNSDFSLEQNLDFITKGLNASFSFFYDNRIITEGGVFDNNNHIRPEGTSNTPLRELIPGNYYPGASLDEYTSALPVIGSDPYDWNFRPWSIRQEDVNTHYWDSTFPIFRRMMYQFQLNYARTFFDTHNVGATGVFKREQYANGSEFQHYREDWVFRLTYDYLSKYFLEANGAYNGSEQFGPGYRFDFFPSVAAGWYVSSENFWKLDWFERLKLRFSIGQVGDDNISGNRWLYSSQYASSGDKARLSPINPFNTNSPYPRYLESVVGNSDIHWEKALKQNFGLETGILKNLISLNVDYFTEKRTDILMAGGDRAIPPFFGIAPPSANIGKVDSKGYEIDLKINKTLPTGLNLWGSLAYTHTENEVIFRDDPTLLDPHLKQQGFPLGQVKMQIRDRISQTWDDVYAGTQMESNNNLKLPGYYNIIDFNGDGQINSLDNAPVGYSGIPQNTYTVSLGSNYRRFSLMVQFYGMFNVSRNWVLNNYGSNQDVLFADYVGDYWSKDNPDSPNPLWRWRTGGGNFYGDRWVFDASILRLQNAELSYTFDQSSSKWLKNYGITSLKLYLNGNNLFFWSDLPDDREGNFAGGGTGAGTYPTLKRVTFGINASF